MGWATFWAIFSQTHPVTLAQIDLEPPSIGGSHGVDFVKPLRPKFTHKTKFGQT
jgi:hypothetical protein